MPILYYVPIIHSVEDYGSLGPAIKEAFVRQTGKVAFSLLQKNIREYWKLVEKRIGKAIPDAHDLVVYQDSLPVGDREKVLAFFGHLIADHQESPNFRLVKKLLEKGATLEGTEDMHLVVEQLKLYQRVAETSSVEEQKEILAAQSSRLQEITRLRDVFIAWRVYDTLPESGTGILFIGRDHDVITELERLPKKFTVISL